MNIVNEIVSDLDKVRNLFKNVLGGTLGVLSSPQLDSIKIALVTAAIQSGTKGVLTPAETNALATQVVGMIDGIGHAASEDIKK